MRRPSSSYMRPTARAQAIHFSKNGIKCFRTYDLLKEKGCIPHIWSETNVAMHVVQVRENRSMLAHRVPSDSPLSFTLVLMYLD